MSLPPSASISLFLVSCSKATQSCSRSWSWRGSYNSHCSHHPADLDEEEYSPSQKDYFQAFMDPDWNNICINTDCNNRACNRSASSGEFSMVTPKRITSWALLIQSLFLCAVQRHCYSLCDYLCQFDPSNLLIRIPFCAERKIKFVARQAKRLSSTHRQQQGLDSWTKIYSWSSWSK